MMAEELEEFRLGWRNGSDLIKSLAAMKVEGCSELRPDWKERSEEIIFWPTKGASKESLEKYQYAKNCTRIRICRLIRLVLRLRLVRQLFIGLRKLKNNINPIFRLY